MLLQIIFSQHNDNNISIGHPFLWDLFKDFVLPISLALFAAGMAYFIFITETKEDKKKEGNKIRQERSDKLMFFSTMVFRSLKTAQDQKDNLKDYIRKIKANDIEFHLMSFVPLNDLKRITEELNLEEYLLAYANYYNKNRKDSIKEFMRIIECIGYLYAVFNEMLKQLEKGQMYDYERKKQFQNLFEKGYNMIGSLLMASKTTDPKLCSNIEIILSDFSANHSGSNYDITFLV